MFSKSLIVAATCLHLALVASAVVAAAGAASKQQQTGLRFGGKPIELDDKNWELMLRGEWMVAFFAPWCRACEDVAAIWDRFARMSGTVAAVHVAQIDLTTSPWLSGRFYADSVPLIYHVKDGEFRQYRGPLYEAALIHFVKKELWKGTEPMSGWMKPDTIHMSIMGFLAKLSHELQGLKVSLSKDFGLSALGSSLGAYVLFVIGIICVSAALGSLLLFLMDFVNGPPPESQRPKIEIEKNGDGDGDGDHGANKDEPKRKLVKYEVLAWDDESEVEPEKVKLPRYNIYRRVKKPKPMYEF